MTKRWDVLAKTINANGYRKCAEVGVKSGRNIDEILRACKGAHFIAVDPWVPTENYSRWKPEFHAIHEKEFDKVKKRWGDRIQKVKAYSADAAKDVPDGSLDLVFIDGDHSYEGVRTDIDCWLPKIRKGGVISGHDYDNTNKYGDAFKGVDRAVHETFGDNFEVWPDHVWLAWV